MRHPGKLEETEREHLAAFLRAAPSLETTYQLIQDFLVMMRKLEGEHLDVWLLQVHESQLPELESFAHGVERDKSAVQAGLTLAINNSQVEEQVTRIKLIKRMHFAWGVPGEIEGRSFFSRIPLTGSLFPGIISVTDISVTDIIPGDFMKKAQRKPEALLPLTPAVFHILLALVDSERHGYGIMQEIAAHTDGAMRMGPGTLYGSIKRMLADGLIEASGERPDPTMDDERRRYYKLTDFGRRVLQAEAQRMEQIVRIAQSKHILSGSEVIGGA